MWIGLYVGVWRKILRELRACSAISWMKLVGGVWDMGCAISDGPMSLFASLHFYVFIGPLQIRIVTWAWLLLPAHRVTCCYCYFSSSIFKLLYSSNSNIEDTWRNWQHFTHFRIQNVTPSQPFSSYRSKYRIMYHAPRVFTRFSDVNAVSTLPVKEIRTRCCHMHYSDIWWYLIKCR